MEEKNISKMVKKYWVDSKDMFPHVFNMSKTFGISPEEILDILLEGFTKTKYVNKLIYHNPNWYKVFSSPYSYGIITMDIKSGYSNEIKQKTLFFVKDENLAQEIFQLEIDEKKTKVINTEYETDLPF